MIKLLKKVSSYVSLQKKRMKQLVFTLQFWLKRSRGKNNDNSDNKYNNTNTR